MKLDGCSIIILTLILGVLDFYLIYKQIKIIKNIDKNSCSGLCSGCTGCSSFNNIKDEYYKDKLLKKE